MRCTVLATFVVAILCAGTGGTCNFNITLSGVQCMGLREVSSATTAEACSSACCASATCSVFEFCPQGSTCTGFVGPSCWVGSANLSQCTREPSWNGAARVVAPPPPPPAQDFIIPFPAAVPLAVVDLGSAVEWTLTIDGGSPCSVIVPGGGYNSDEQTPPFLDSALTISDATYSRAFSVPPPPDGELPASGTVTTTIEFGVVNYGAEVYVDGALAGAHRGPNMPFAVDISALIGEPGSVHNLTVVSRPFVYFEGSVPSTFTYAETWLHPPDGWSSRTPNGTPVRCRKAWVAPNS